MRIKSIKKDKPLTQLKPHIYAALMKVFGLAFFKKQVGLGNAQGFEQ
ncbi:MAG: hypothetical protein VB018_06750 [Lachnospiraceae bacterium]|nr:hypothetical protein [Lachnospiraceae bacterium]